MSNGHISRNPQERKYNMKKRLLSLILVIMLAASLVPAAYAADVSYAVTGGNISFDVATGTVTGCGKDAAQPTTSRYDPNRCASKPIVRPR